MVNVLSSEISIPIHHLRPGSMAPDSVNARSSNPPSSPGDPIHNHERRQDKTIPLLEKSLDSLTLRSSRCGLEDFKAHRMVALRWTRVDLKSRSANPMGLTNFGPEVRTRKISRIKGRAFCSRFLRKPHKTHSSLPGGKRKGKSSSSRCG